MEDCLLSICNMENVTYDWSWLSNNMFAYRLGMNNINIIVYSYVDVMYNILLLTTKFMLSTALNQDFIVCISILFAVITHWLLL